MSKNFWYGTTALVGAIVGVGVFGIPFVSVQAGFWVGSAYIVVLGGAVLLTHLLYGEVVERTPGDHRLTGHAAYYFGSWGKWLVGAVMLLGAFGGQLAYILIAGEFLDVLFPNMLSPFLWAAFFWAVGSLFIWRGVRLMALGEVLMTVALMATMLFIFTKGVGHINPLNFSGVNLREFLTPYGVVLFALIGINAVPEVRAIMRLSKADLSTGSTLQSNSGQAEGGSTHAPSALSALRRAKRDFKWAIVVGTLLPALLYLIFNAVVVGVAGDGTSPEAIRGLVPFLGEVVARVGALFGLLAVLTSFLIFGAGIKNTLILDWNIARIPAVLLAVVTPFVLYAIGLREFISIIGLTGAVFGALMGPIVILLFLKARKAKASFAPPDELRRAEALVPAFEIKVPIAVLYMVGAIFVLGGLFEIYRFLN